jgi:Ger(x)C family germination protein
MKINFKKIQSLIYALVIIFLSFLFFTNDFGLVDIRKTSVIVGVGIDVEDEAVQVTAQVAVPQPAENGENTQFTGVNGSGQTVSEALNEINARIGFYPKLIFCKLIILGESCQGQDIFKVLDYFYRNEYTQLTPIVAMCKGSAGDLLQSKLPFGETAVVSIERLLSEEAKKTGNVSTVNLKCIGLQQYSPSTSCYMPYIESIDNSAEQGGQESEQSGQEGQGGGSSQSNQPNEQSGSSQGGQTEKQLICSKTAIFSGGNFKGVLNEEEALALNLIRNEIRHTTLSCTADGDMFSLGLRECNGRIKLNIDGGKPKLIISFKAAAQIQDVDKASTPKQAAENKRVPDTVIKSAEENLKEKFDGIVQVMKREDCDFLGIKKLLYRLHYKYYDTFKDTLFDEMKVEYNVKIKSSN